MAASCETRCSVCKGCNAASGTEWVRRDEEGWWHPVCSGCWSAVESTISMKVRQHYGGDKLRALVAERALLMAEVVHQTSGCEPQRFQRRRLN